MITESRIDAFTAEAVRCRSLTNDEPDWLLDSRLAAMAEFDRLPLPTRQDEEWRRTDLAGLALDHLVIDAEARQSVSSPLALESGAYGGFVSPGAPETSALLEPHVAELGVILCELGQAVNEHADLVRRYLGKAVSPESDKFAALNAACWNGGVFLYVPRGVECILPLRALYGLEGGGRAATPHSIIVLEDGARATYVEEYASGSTMTGSLSCGTVEVFVGPEAHLTLVSLQEFAAGSYDINTQRARLDRDAALDWLVIGLGGGVTKSNIDVALQGQGARTQMLGILWGYGKAHTNYQTLQDHQAPNCTSDLLYKGALTDEAVSVFSGRIRVEKGAQRTDSYQANRTVILSGEAAAFPSPNLEIEANDVRCTHGASVGKVDAEQLFYLMSRGLSGELATKMIVEGFFEEVLEREPGAAIRDNLRQLIRRKIEERATA